MSRSKALLVGMKSSTLAKVAQGEAVTLHQHVRRPSTMALESSASSSASPITIA